MSRSKIEPIGVGVVILTLCAIFSYYKLSNGLELLGFATGSFGVYWVIRESLWNFPFQIISSVCYIKYFADNKLPGQMILMYLYAGFMIYGWALWRVRNAASDDPLRVKFAHKRHLAMCAIAFGIFWLLAYSLLQRMEGEVVLIDSALLVGTLIAQFMTDRKWVESWMVWLVLNLTYVILYLQRGYYATAILSFLFFSLALMGLYEWKMKRIP